tara:strand:+ start:334 stop:531 length:198 start_codon:yes stop_codon:yes gene_type:complete
MDTPLITIGNFITEQTGTTGTTTILDPSTPVGLIETIIITGMAFLITIPLGIRTIKNLTIIDKEQ